MTVALIALFVFSVVNPTVVPGADTVTVKVPVTIFEKTACPLLSVTTAYCPALPTSATNALLTGAPLIVTLIVTSLAGLARAMFGSGI